MDCEGCVASVDFGNPDARAKALEHEKHVERIRRDARRAVAAEPPPLGEVPLLKSHTLAELPNVFFERRRPLLMRADMSVLNEGHLGEIYGLRGLGKTWLLQSLALVAATGVDALGFTNPNKSLCRVLYVDGEMAGEDIQERFARLCRLLAVPEKGRENLTIIGADWQEFLPRLDTREGQEALEPHVQNADLIILDNRSCLFDPEGEKDATAWQPAQDWLLSLRKRGKAVLVVHHANRQGGARGHSKPEDVMNLLLKLSRPEDYTADEGARFIVEFEKARGAFGAPVAPFLATLTKDGWKAEPLTDNAEDNHAAEKLRDYLVLANRVGERPKTATAAVREAHVNKAAGLHAFAAMKERGEILQHADGGYCLKDTDEGVGF
jgi:hypothetical protein